MQYLQDRLNELRTKYRDTGEAKWRYKYEEVQRMLEHYMAEQIRSEQDSGQVQGRDYNPAPPYF